MTKLSKRTGACAVFVAALFLRCSRSSAAPPATALHTIRTDDFCSGVEIYAGPDDRLLLGVLTLQRPVETADGKRIADAVNLRSLVESREVTLWRSRSELMHMFVRDHDPALNHCRWFTQETVYRLGNDIPPTVRLEFDKGWHVRRTSPP